MGTFALDADGALTFARVLFGWGRRSSRVRFEATDIDWSRGSGDVARGPIEAITMVLAGRRPAVADFGGPGSREARVLLSLTRVGRRFRREIWDNRAS